MPNWGESNFLKGSVTQNLHTTNLIQHFFPMDTPRNPGKNLCSQLEQNLSTLR